MQKRGNLILADGTVYRGKCLTSVNEGPWIGELVFSTSMTGYAEILTDPSYYEQIVILANPEVGNYGVNIDDFQSTSIKAKALVVKNLSSCSSSYRSQMTLADWLARENVPLFSAIDTRALITHIRNAGVMLAAITSDENAPLTTVHVALKKAAENWPRRLSLGVSVRSRIKFEEGLKDVKGQRIPAAKKRFKVVVLDCGVKSGILRHLFHRGAELQLMPADSAIEEIWALKPDGIFLSNGPGDPKYECLLVTLVRNLLGKIPIFGVCLGHQILAQALGMKTFKLKFGHRGSNQPVRVMGNKVVTTAQNHGYAICQDKNAPDYYFENNISDGTNEGIEAPKIWAFSVQYHPEGAPGPMDAANCFDKFFSYMESWQNLYKQRGINSEGLSQEGILLGQKY